MSLRCGRLFGALGVLLAWSGLIRADAPTFEDDGPLPPRAVARLGTYRLWLGTPVSAVAFSPDGKLVASGRCYVRTRPPEDGGWETIMEVRLWEAATGRPVRRIAEVVTAQSDFLQLAFSPDAKLLAGACEHRVLVWETASGRELLRRGAFSRVQEFLRFAADGKSLVAGEAEGIVQSWELAIAYRLLFSEPWKGGPPRRKDGKAAETCRGCALSPDGKVVAREVWRGDKKSDSLDPLALRLCDASTGKQVYQLDGSKDEIGLPTFSPDGRVLATARACDQPRLTPGPERIQFWDAASGRKLREVPITAFGLDAMAFSPDGRILASYAGGVVSLWDVKTRTRCRKWYFPDELGYRSRAVLSYSPDGKRVAVGGGRWVRVLDTTTRKDRPALPGLRLPVGRVAFSRDGRTLTAFSYETFGRWRTATWEEAGRFDAGPLCRQAGEAPLAVAPEAGVLACAPPDLSGTVRLRDLRTGKLLRPLKGKHAAGGHDLTSGFFSADGKRVFFDRCTKDFFYLSCHAVDSGEEVGTVKLPDFPAFAISATGESVVAVGPDGILTLTDVGTGKALRRFGGRLTDNKEEPAPARLLALSPDGQLVADTADGRHSNRYANKDCKPIRIWRVASGEELQRITLHLEKTESERVVCLAFSPDGRTLATAHFGAGEKWVRLWEVATGRERGRLEGHRDWVVSLAFSPDGRLLASSGDDGVVLVWDATGALTKRPTGTKLSDADLTDLWADLADADARRAWEAQRTLVAAPEASAPFLRGRLRPVPAADAEKVARLIADLDSDRFAARDRALRGLAALHEAAAPGLEEALRGRLSLEARRKVERLLAGLRDGKSARQLRQVRAVEALEHLGTGEARLLLAALAGGVPQARLTREAKAALRRLDGRSAAALKAQRASEE
jgi:WD40 repeat protein